MARRRRRGKGNRTAQPQQVHPNAAGLDVGATEIYAAVRAERAEQPIQSFLTYTRDLHGLADWLIACGVDTVAMESTGVYWIPPYQILEARGLEVVLVNARHVRSVPGRKTDVSDCEWLRYLHSVGLLRGSFRPADEVCAVRALLRHRDSLVKGYDRKLWTEMKRAHPPKNDSCTNQEEYARGERYGQNDRSTRSRVDPGRDRTPGSPADAGRGDGSRSGRVSRTAR